MNFVAITQVSYPPEMREGVQACGLALVKLAKSSAGYIYAAFHHSISKDETMIYWEWSTEKHHKTFFDSPEFQSVMTEFSSVFEGEGFNFSIDTYHRIK